MVVIIFIGGLGFFNTSLITLITIKIDIIMGGEVVIISAQGGVLLHTARKQTKENKKGNYYPVYGVTVRQISPVLIRHGQVPTNN